MAEILTVTHVQSSSKNSVCRKLLLELSGPPVILTDSFPPLPESLKPLNAAHWLLCDKCPSTGALRSTQSTIHPPKAQLELQQPKPQSWRETSAITQATSCLLQVFFFSLPTLYTLQIVSYFPKRTRLREQLIIPPTVEICKTKVAPGDEKAPSALCQASPLVLSCCNLNPFYKTTLSPSQKLSYSQHLSGSDP